MPGTSLVVQWLRIPSNEGNLGSIPGAATKPPCCNYRAWVPQLQRSPCATVRVPHATPKTQRSQIKNIWKLFPLSNPVGHLTVALLVLILTSWAIQGLFSQASTVPPLQVKNPSLLSSFNKATLLWSHWDLELHPASGQIGCWSARLNFLV